MRMLIDVGTEDAEWLRKLANQEHRTPREQASYLLHKMIQAALGETAPSPTAEQAA